MNKIIDLIKNFFLLVLTLSIITAILILPFQMKTLIYEVRKLQAINVEIYKRESQHIQKL